MEKLEGDVFQTPERAVGKAKVRLVPECYIFPRRSIPRTIALYSFLTMAGVGAGMLVENWIKQQVESITYELESNIGGLPLMWTFLLMCMMFFGFTRTSFLLKILEQGQYYVAGH